MTLIRWGIIVIYFGILLLLAPINLLSFDTYYYWDWSRHLDIAYYDGSPMIAYFIKLSTLLFGDTLFALSVVGIVTAAVTSWIIYKTARLFLHKEASFVVVFLWLFSPLVTLDILKQTTYDTPLMLFWALTIYFVAKFTQSNHIKYLYGVGVSIGLMMLAKYSGVVLVLALFIFLLTTTYRHLFKSAHFYFAALLAIVLFSPVIVWNIEHGWLSFHYQLTTHQLKDTVNPFFNVFKAFFLTFIPALNFMLLPILLCWLKKTDKPIIVRLCMVICTTFFFFYLFVATKATLREYWLTPYLISSALLAGFCFQTFHYRKSAFLLIIVYGLTSLGIMMNSTYRFSITPQKIMYYHLIQQLNKTYPQLPNTVLTTGWFEARMLFFLQHKPKVYTIDCGSPQNQYALWSTDIVQKIKNKTLHEVLYIDLYNRINCVKKYFDKCVPLDSPTYTYKHATYQIYTYRCTNGDVYDRS